jgi:hypothetical protein
MDNCEDHNEEIMSAKEINVPQQLDPDPFYDQETDETKILN